jgi:hypothetical protein
MALIVGMEFDTIREAGDAMRRWVIDSGESYRVDKCEKKSLSPPMPYP